MGWFLCNGNTGLKQANPNHPLFHILFFPFMKKLSFPKCQTNVLLNTNQIKLYTYPDLLKENPLLRKFLNSESTAYFLDETFYHTHILLFSTTISAAIFIKASK